MKRSKGYGATPADYPIRIETWRCGRCGYVEKVEIMEEGDGMIGEWMCAQPHIVGQPMCGGIYSQSDAAVKPETLENRT